MKRKIIVIAASVFLVIVCLLSAKDTKPTDEKKIQIKKQVSELLKNYNNAFYKSVFSIEELKPYFIMEIDKISELYNNHWLSPATMLEKLNDRDKELVVKKLIDYIYEINDPLKENALLSKINSWCNAQWQFDFFSQKLGFSHEIIINTIYSITVSKPIVAQYYIQRGPNNINLTPEQIEKAYFETLNMVAGFKFEEQMKYYSDMYNKLGTISKND